MKVKALGVKRIHGISSKSGNEFDMCNLICSVPVQTGSGKSTKVEGYGFESAEIPLDPAALPAFAKVNFPADIDVETDSRPYMGKLETFVVGIKDLSKVKAVA